jgi:hypothetical protein
MKPRWGFLMVVLSTGSLRRAAGRQIGQALTGLFASTLSACALAEDRVAAYRSMNELVFALAAYRAEQGEYPAELAKICPKTRKPKSRAATGASRAM